MSCIRKFMSHDNKKSGFTLIELVASMAIMVIIGSIIFSIYILSYKSTTKTRWDTTIQDKYRIAIMNLENDIRYSSSSSNIPMDQVVGAKDSLGGETLLSLQDSSTGGNYILYVKKGDKLFKLSSTKNSKNKYDMKREYEVLNNIKEIKVEHATNQKINIKIVIEIGKESKTYNISVLSRG